MSKYHAVPTKAYGFSFGSKAEKARYEYWLLLLKADEIEHIDVHPVVTLPGAIRWVLDFAIWTTKTIEGETCPVDVICVQFEDVKGFETEAFKIKRKLFDREHPAAPLHVVQLRGKRWVEL